MDEQSVRIAKMKKMLANKTLLRRARQRDEEEANESEGTQLKTNLKFFR